MNQQMTKSKLGTIPVSPQVIKAIWRVADPKITLASGAGLILGLALAVYSGTPIHWGWFFITFLGIFFVEAAKNASGEVFDWNSGTDKALRSDERTPFSGGKRVIVDGLLNTKQTAVMAAVFYTLAIVIGLLITFLREPSAFWIGTAGVLIAYFYHGKPFALSYRGLGELAVGLCYGPLIVAGTYLVQTGNFKTPIALASIPLGLTIAAFLWVNEFPDSRADSISGKKTLVVRLGKKKASWIYLVLIAITYILVASLPMSNLPVSILWGLAAAPLSLIGAIKLIRAPDNSIPTQILSLVAFILLALGMSFGLVFA